MSHVSGRLLVLALGALAPLAYAQQAVPRPPGQEDGFFRPSADPALTRFPSTSEIVNPPSPPAIAVPVDPGLVAAQQASRDAAERELERASRESDRAAREARASLDAFGRPAPMIVSPLDGTAPIVSPLGR